jgi:type I restriction enzyme S subunit
LVLFKKNELLRQTRDLLLPKLISGQLDVEDLDIEIGEQPEEATT